MLDRLIFLATGLLSIVCLFTPFVWMEIGPLGHEYYRPIVPDIYIYGGFITGKDLSFWGISFGMNFQLGCNILFAVLSLLALFITNRKNLLILLGFQTLLLALFPLWLEIYINGVKHNSDCADLTMHYQIGMLFYGILIGLNLFGFIHIKWTRLSKKQLPR